VDRKKFFIDADWEYFIEPAIEYGYKVTIYKNGDMVNTQSGFGNEAKKNFVCMYSLPMV